MSATLVVDGSVFLPLYHSMKCHARVEWTFTVKVLRSLAANLAGSIAAGTNGVTTKERCFTKLNIPLFSCRMSEVSLRNKAGPQVKYPWRYARTRNLPTVRVRGTHKIEPCIVRKDVVHHHYQTPHLKCGIIF